MSASIGHRMKLTSGLRISRTRTQVQNERNVLHFPLWCLFRDTTDHTLNRHNFYLLRINISFLISSLDLSLYALSLLDLLWNVLVYGRKNRNRAVHGDEVVVELLPKNEWRGKVTALTQGQGDEKSGEDSESTPMPTGENAQTPLNSVRFYFLSISLIYESKMTRKILEH